MIFQSEHIGQKVDCAACGLRGTIIRKDRSHKPYMVGVKFDEGFIVSYTPRGKLNNDTGEPVLSLVQK